MSGPADWNKRIRDVTVTVPKRACTTKPVFILHDWVQREIIERPLSAEIIEAADPGHPDVWKPYWDNHERKEAGRKLTPEERDVMHRAQRRSVRVVHKATDAHPAIPGLEHDPADWSKDVLVKAWQEAQG